MGGPDGGEVRDAFTGVLFDTTVEGKDIVGVTDEGIRLELLDELTEPVSSENE